MKFVKILLIIAGLTATDVGLASAEGSAEVGRSEQVGGDIVRAPSSLTGTRNGVSRKRYPGGADEDDLQVQAILPIPSRTFDGAVTNAAVESGAADSAPPATND